MKERPILFNGDMVRAILDGHKTQTRRVVDVSKIKPSTWKHEGIETIRPVAELGWNHKDQWQAKTNRYNVWSKGFLCPYGKVGDRLWVRESGWKPKEPTLRDLRDGADTWPKYVYAADGVSDWEKEQFKDWGWRSRPSIHMPRWASRITLEITSVRVERVQDISETDAIAEGINPTVFDEFDIAEIKFEDPECLEAKVLDILGPVQIPAKVNFMTLWDKINGKTHSWASNPFVWVLEFKRIEEAK